MGAGTDLQMVGSYLLLQGTIMVRAMAKGHRNLEAEL